MSKEKQASGGAKSPIIEDKNQRNMITLILAIIGYAIIYLLATGYWAISGLNEFGIALVVIVILGIVIKGINAYSGWGPLFLLSTRKGITFIDHLSKKYQAFWTEMPMWGMVLGFGILTYPFLKNKISKKTFVFGIVSLVIVLLYVLPSLGYGLQFVNLPQIQQAAHAAASAPPNPGQQFLVYGIIILSGFSGFVLVELAWNAFLVLLGVAQYLSAQIFVGVSNTVVLTSQVAGVAPIIPGFQIPLVAGVIAFALCLIIHEMSHGVLSRIYKVKLKSVGLLMVGIIPMGGFVEPDDKQLNRLDDTKQTKMYAAGVASNFVLMIIFFILLLPLVYYVLPNIEKVIITATVPNTPAYNAIPIGTQIYYWNSIHVKSLASLDNISEKPGEIITLNTSNGTFMFTAVSIDNSARGYVGVDLGQVIQNNQAAGAWYFIYSVIALSLVINFLIGIANMLPIPGFDGWKIYAANIKRKKLLGTIAALVLIILVLNAVPWFFDLALCHTATLTC
jgi:Zn-dependent protease